MNSPAVAGAFRFDVVRSLIYVGVRPYTSHPKALETGAWSNTPRGALSSATACSIVKTPRKWSQPICLSGVPVRTAHRHRR